MTVVLDKTKMEKFDGTDRTRFNVDIPFTKAATSAKGDLILKGYASTWQLDRDGEFIHPTAFDDSLPAYLANNPIVLWQHDPCCPMGTVTDGTLDATGLLVEVIIPKPDDNEPDWLHLAYNRIARGVVCTFSIGGYMDRVWEETLMMPMVVKVELFEISVVSIPANESSIFAAAVKAANGDDPAAPRLRGHVIEQMEAILGMTQTADPELREIMSSDATKGARYIELARIYQAAGFDAPAQDEWAKACVITDITDKIDAVERCIVKARGSVRLSNPDGLKAGRVLSKANEDMLTAGLTAMKSAMESIHAVLGQIPSDDPQDTAQVDDPGGSDEAKAARTRMQEKAARAASMAAGGDGTQTAAQMRASAAAIAAAVGDNDDDAAAAAKE